MISLRETFFEGAANTIDLRAKVINAETTDIIGQYILFCRVLDSQVRRFGATREAAEAAIRICQDRGVMTEYLEDRKKEVMDIMVMLFDQEYAVKQFGIAQEKKGRLEGTLKTLSGLVRDGLLTVGVAAKKADMTEDEFKTMMNRLDTEEETALRS